MQATPDTEVLEVVCTNRRFVRSRMHQPAFCLKSPARTAIELGYLGVLLVLGGQRLWWTGWQITVEAGAGDTRGFDDLGDWLILLIAKVCGVGELRWIDPGRPADPFKCLVGHACGAPAPHTVIELVAPECAP